MFKKGVRISLYLLMGLFLLLGLFQGDHGTLQATASWSFVEPGADTGINYDLTKDATEPVMAVYNNELYAAWSESNGSATLIRVKKYNGGTSWSFVDGGANGLNKDPTKNALDPALVVFNGNLYAAWDEMNGSYRAIRVRRYDGGTTWTQVDGDTAQGLNRVATPAYDPTMVVYNGELYLAWEQAISSVNYIHVKKYVSGTTWSFVDGNTDPGLNHAAYNAFHPNMAVCNNLLYIAWTELNNSSGGTQQIRVRRYDGGSSWTFVDGNLTNGLNLTSSCNANAPWLVSLNNTLYAAWDEPDLSSNEHAHLRRYDGGNTWTFVDDANQCLNRLPQFWAYSPKIAVFDNIAYIAWDEEDPSYTAQIRVKQYNGSIFSFIAGGSDEGELNKYNSKAAKTPFPIIFNGDLYIAWYESHLSSSVTQIRVKKYPLPPVVNSVTVPANGTYIVGQNLDFIVNFNKAVNVSGPAPTIPVLLSSGSVNATYLSGSGTTALTFRYPVTTGNLDSDGITVGSSISLPGSTIRDTVNNLDADLNLNNVPSTSAVLVDAVVPTVSSFDPVNNAVNILTTANLHILFSENIAKGTGNITIKKTSDDSTVQTISVAGTNVTVAGNSVTIDLTTPLVEETQYYVFIDATAFHDTAGNNYAGISNKTTWHFTTKDSTPPSGYSVNIDQEYINNANKTNLSFTFAGAEVGATYNYTLTSSGGGIPVTDSETVSSATQNITGINTTGLNDGTLTLSFTLTDTAVNTGTAATKTIVKDIVVPTLDSVAKTDNTHLLVTLSENCKNLTGGFTVSETDNPNKTYAVTGTVQGTDASHVVLTVANMAASGGKGVKVKYTAGTDGTIQDVAGNAMATNSAGVSVAAWDTTAPTLVSVTWTNDTNLTVGLSENCTNLTNANTGGFTAEETGNPGNKYAVSATAPGTDASHIVLTVASIKVSGKEGVTVKYTAGGDGIIQDIAGNDMDTDSTGVTVAPWDVTAPSITASTLDANNRFIDISFSEPVFGADTGASSLTVADFGLTFVANSGNATNAVIYSVKKNDNTVESSASALTGGDTVIRVFLTITGKPSGVETIEIKPANSASIYDKAGNATANSETTGVKLLKDKFGPTLVSATRTNNTHITVMLSENSVNLTKEGTGGFTVVELDDPGINYAVTAIAQGEDPSQVFLTVANMANSGKEGVKVKYTAGTDGTIQDVAGNAMATNSAGVSVAAWDTTAPTLVSVTWTNDTNLTVGLSENCTNLTNANTGGFTVEEAGNPSNKYTVSATAPGTDASHIVLTVASMKVSGKEGVTVKYTAGGDGIIQDIAGNDMVTDSTGVSIAPWDVTAPSITASTLDANNRFIDITFSEPVFGADTGASALTASDFALTFEANGGNATNAVINSVKKNDNTVESSASALTGGEIVIRVFLTITGKPSGVETIEIKPANSSSIYDKAGNATADSVTTGVMLLKDKFGPTLVSATRTNNTHIKVMLSENSVNLTKEGTGGFTVVELGDPGIKYAVTAIAQGEDPSQVVLTVANMAISGKEGVKVKYTAGTDGTIQDLAGNAMATNSAGVSVTAWDTTAPTLVSVTRTNDTHLTVALSENCTNLTNANTGGFTVEEVGNPGKTYNVSSTAPGTDASHIILTVASMKISGKEGVTVKYTAGGDGIIRDIAGNDMVTDSTGVSTAPWHVTAPSITTSTLNAGNRFIDITFSEPVFGADTGASSLTVADFGLTFVANSGNATNAVISSVKKNDNTVESSASVLTGGETVIRVFLSITGKPSGVETIEIKPASSASIYDKAGNATTDSESTGAKLLSDKLGPIMVSAARTNNTHLTVTLSENAVNLTKTGNGGFTVIEWGNPVITYAVTATAQGEDPSHVVLTVASMAISGKEGVKVKYTAGTNGTIQDVAGNAMSTNSVGVSIAGWDTVAPTISSGTLAANNGYIDLVFSKGVYGASDGLTPLTAAKLALTFTANSGNATNVTISSVKKNDSTVESTASALTGNETTIRVFLIKTGIPSGVETIEINPANDTSIYDKAGNAVSASETTGVKTLNDKLAPTLVNAVRTDNTYIQVTLSEDCINITKANNGGFTVNEVGNATVTYAVTAINQGTDAHHIILTVADIGASSTKGVKIKYTAGTNGTIQDVAGNAMATNSTGVAVVAW